MGDLVEGSPSGLRKGSSELGQISIALSKIARQLESAPGGSSEASKVAVGSSTGALDLSAKIKDQSAELNRRANLFEQAGNAGIINVRALNTKVLSWIETGALISFFAAVKNFPANIYSYISNLGSIISSGTQTLWGKITNVLSPKLNLSNSESIDKVASAAEQAAKRKLEEARKQEIESLLKQYDGKSYADGTYFSKDNYSSLPVNPPITNNSSQRDPNIYNVVLNQFGVETNPRYKSRNNNTYCNIFVWDATKAMGAEIPHWIDQKTGAPVDINNYLDMKKQGLKPDITPVELNANSVVNWMSKSSQNYGWHTVTAEEAQLYANKGCPAVAVWANPDAGAPGHVAMVRPGDYSSVEGPFIAQAGGENHNLSRISKNFYYGWKNDEIVYYVHE